MARDWETWLHNSIGPASDTEEQDRDRTERRIRDAILAEGRLAGKVRVFVKGSYANGTNVRRDSDVDVAVEWKRWAYISKSNTAAPLSWDQLGVPLGPIPIT
jgi:tRNA nucleotidyltransferase (CCA-adding enzyme)